MKIKKQILFILAFFSIIILVFSSTENGFSHISTEKESITWNMERIPFSNIVINDDGDWATYGINGSGSLADPYLIENLEIVTSESYGIFIVNTVKAFLIKNCYVSSSIDGMYIWNATAGARIEGNVIEYLGQTGIKCYRCPNTTIIYNKLDYGGTYGQGIAHTGNFSIIAHNYVTGFDMGIWTSGGYTEVYNNTVESVQRKALMADAGDKYKIYNNTCSFNGDGIYVCDSSYSEIYNNTCSFNGGNGTRLDLSYGCEVKYNWFEANEEFGVVLAYQSSNNIIHHNVFIGNEGGTEQAYFEGPTNGSEGNLWYDPTTLEGNYWDDWDGDGFYEIGGGYGEVDLYPLAQFANLPEIDEYSTASLLSICIITTAIMPLIYFVRKKRK